MLQDHAQLFVSAWMCLGSVARVAAATDLTRDETALTASLLRDLGVRLPQEPVDSPDAAGRAGWAYEDFAAIPL